MSIASIDIGAAQPRQLVKVAGTVIAIQVEPKDGAPVLTARLDDGTGRLDAVFMGRRAIPGVEPGQRMSVEGRLATGQGTALIYNPKYELL